MAKDLNHLQMIGRATADCKIKTVGQLTIGEFSIAVNDIKKDGEEVSFFNCTMFGKLAENVGKYVTKGKQIAIVGKLKQDRWEQDGQNRSNIKIIIQELQLLGGGSSVKETEESFEKLDEGLDF